MARGFESKSVTSQQEEAEARDPKPRSRRGGGGEPDPAVVLRRRKLELARADILQRMQQAHAEAHKEMLRRALDALEKELKQLG